MRGLREVVIMIFLWVVVLSAVTSVFKDLLGAILFSLLGNTFARILL